MQKVRAYRMGVALLVVYKLVMDLFYTRCIYKVWEREIWWSMNPNHVDAMVSWMVYAAILLLFLPVLRKPFSQYMFSDFVLFFLLLVSVVPGLSICGAGTFPKGFIGWFSIYWIVMFLLARFSYFEKGNGFIVPRFSLDSDKKRRAFRMICAFFAACVLFVFFHYGGGRFFASSLLSLDVYAVREEWGIISLSMPALLRYILANASVVFCFLLLHSLDQKRYALAGIACLLQYMYFSCGAHKIAILMMAICIAVYVLRNIVDVRWVVGVVMGGACFIDGAYEIGKNWGFVGMGDRMFYLPNMLSWCYYDYFQNHLPILYGLFGYGTVGRADVPAIIGAWYGEAVGTYANNGLFGDAVMMAGVYGVILGPVLWSLYLCVLDKAGRNVGFVVRMGMGLCWALVMLNCPVTTSMLSHGGVMLVVLSCLQDGGGRGGDMAGP